MLNKDVDNNKREKLKSSNNSEINDTNKTKYQLHNYLKKDLEDSSDLEEHKKPKKIRLAALPEMKTKEKYKKSQKENNSDKNQIIDFKERNNKKFDKTMIYNKKYIQNLDDIEKMSQTKKGYDNISQDNESTSSEAISKSNAGLTKYKIMFDKVKEKERDKEKENEREKIKIYKNKIKNKNDLNLNSDLSILQKSFNNDDIKKIIKNKIGFNNLGNTCFMNTCLQNLIHSEYFIKLLFSKLNLISKNTPITYYFIKLCIELKDNYGISAISPNDFQNIFSKKHRMFRGFRQHDTQEFCRILLEDMNRELNEIKNPAPYKELSTMGKSKLICNEEFDKTFKERENSLIMECFYSQIINIFKCKCGFETYSFEKILDFPLLFKEDSKKIKLTELLDDYFKKEKIKFETRCESCKRKEEHIKTIYFSQPPNILIFSLQRRNERTGRKNDAYIKFPEILDIGKYIDKECGHKDENEYILYGIGNHLGDMNFGHYYAYIKLDGEGWFEYNDSRVNRNSEVEKSSRSAYVLFYKKYRNH